MTVHIPSTLRSYTKQKRALEAEGHTVAEINVVRIGPSLSRPALSHRHGARHNQAAHQIFFNDRQISTLAGTVTRDDRVYIICALSGG